MRRIRGSGLTAVVAAVVAVIAAGASVGAMAGCADGSEGGGADSVSADALSAPVVGDPFFGEAAAGRAAALYLTITQEGGDDRLVAVSTEVSDVVGLMPAQMAMDDPMTDRSVDMPVVVGEPVEFLPGDDHLMAINVSRDLDPGDNVEVTLVFERHGEMTVQAKVLSLLDINERVADRRDDEGGSDR